MDGKEIDSYKYGQKFKFKSLRVYCSTEWMANSTKKYRQVFDRDEVDYIRVELAFYNKMFDEEDWNATIKLKAFQQKGTKKVELCDQMEKMKITATQNVVYVHKGWGTDRIGGFWKKGEYFWEAYIDDNLIGVARFYVEEVGRVTSSFNPYFDLESVKLFSGPYDGWSIKNRTYLKKFNREQTQYVWVEVKIKNKASTDWHCELFMNHYDHAGQPKAQILSFREISKGRKNQTISFEEGWGSKEGGTWRDDKYSVEIVFMDTLIAVVPFEVGNEDVEGDSQMIIPTAETTVSMYKHDTVNPNGIQNTENQQEETLESVMRQLDGLIGLFEIKKKIRDHISYLDFLKLRVEKGLNDNEPLTLHSVFTGNPGTGKTTVVNLLGKLYNKIGLLSKGHVHEVDRVDLVGEFIGQTAPKVKEAIEEARGGILFIDEAYMLARKDGDSKDFGKEVIEVLIKEMSDGDGDIAIMFAGYPEEMETMLNSNPGLRSRVRYYFHFDDYTPDELYEISDYACTKRGVSLTPEANKHVRKIILEAYRNRNKMFGNARYAFSLIDEGKMNLGLRVMKHPNVKSLSVHDLSTVIFDDVKEIAAGRRKQKINIEIDEDMLRESVHELNALIGLDNIKKDVNELIKLVRYYNETGKNVLNRFSLHTVFVGNPGTGKTTVTRILGKIFKSLGLLERGHVVECDREGLIAGYIGQTAIKTKERTDEAKGGVLFIDEAYSLAEGSQNSYGGEAIEVILKNMEDMRGEFAVIVAGYPDKMNDFLNSNPGLRSRFDRKFVFNDFTADHLYDIALFMLDKENLKPDEDAAKELKRKLEDLHARKDKFFGNARSVRNLVTEAVKNQNLRMAFIPKEQRSEEMLETLTKEDLREINMDKDFYQAPRRTIGF